MSRFHRAVFRFAALAAAGLLLAACGDESEPTATAQSGAAGADEAPTTRSCLAAHAEDPCAVLTESLVRKALPDTPATIEQTSRTGSYAACAYSWPSDRTRAVKIGNNSVDVNEDNTVSLSWIETYKGDPQSQFRRSYLPTAEEQARAREVLAGQFDKQAEKEGLTEQQKEIGQAMAEGALDRQPQSQAIDGLGSMAATSGNDLYVLHGNTKFQVSADVSADLAADHEAAIAVARLLIESCD